MRPETLKLLEENKNIVIGNNFLNKTPIVQELKELTNGIA
jgi:hypothetical protein